jgi:GH24 family phage-related lysozyme (muramidase)
MINRRTLFGIPAFTYLLLTHEPVYAESASFSELLSSLTDVDALGARASREYRFRLLVQTESQQGVRRRAKSKMKISDRARELIVRFEVSSKARYEKEFQGPIWPGGESGVTVGIGYDLGYMTPALVEADWDSILEPTMISELVRATGKKGNNARAFLSKLNGISIPWKQANEQFDRFLPSAIAEAEYAFPNLDKLTQDARGALVSLVYNRGGDTRNTPRRKEMYNIKQHMAVMNFSVIPDEIRSMKRIWKNDNLPGLLLRRELEAALFEEGLR